MYSIDIGNVPVMYVCKWTSIGGWLLDLRRKVCVDLQKRDPFSTVCFSCMNEELDCSLLLGKGERMGGYEVYEGVSVWIVKSLEMEMEMGMGNGE